MDRVYKIKPLAHILNLSGGPINQPPLYAQWPSENVMASVGRVERRWDHSVVCTLASGDVIKAIPVYSQNTGVQTVFVLTETDLIVPSADGSKYSYKTPTWTTGSITSVNGGISGKEIVGSGTGWNGAGIEAGDQFIIDADHDATDEPDTGWTSIASVTDDTHIELSTTYSGASSGTYKIRKPYSLPAGSMWTYAVVNGKLCFTHGSEYAQYWSPTTTYATDLNTTYARNARYCLSYANRLWLADLYDSDIAGRNPWLLRGSKFRDATDFTDTTSVDYTFYDASEPIMGLGSVDGQMVVYKKNMYHIGSMTTTSTDPIQWSGLFHGPGLYAPYSLVQFMSTNAWLGMDDFYVMNGNVAQAIGEPIRKKFFAIVDEDDLANAIGIHHAKYNEIMWMVNTREGQIVVAWNYKEKQWAPYSFSSPLTAFGGYGWY